MFKFTIKRYLFSGRILNRFTKDLGEIDDILPGTFLHVVQLYSLMIGILVLNAISLYYTLLPTALLLLLKFLFMKIYLRTAQSIKRLEGTSEYNLKHYKMIHYIFDPLHSSNILSLVYVFI